MRILAVSNRYPPWSLGGYETIAAGTAAALRRTGHRVRVLTTVPDSSDRPVSEPAGGDIYRQLRWYWREHRFPRSSLLTTVALERANARTLARHFQELRPDAVLWWAMGGMSLSLLEQVRRAGMPAVGVVGDDWMTYAGTVDAWTRRFAGWRGASAPLAERVVGVPASVDIAAAARWVFISEHVRSRAPLGGHDRASAATVAHPGVDPLRFAPRAPLPWRWRLLSCGRIDPRKGLTTAIEALSLLPVDARLMIDGDGDRGHARELSTLAGRLGVGGRVRFHCSAPEQVPGSYAAADAIVFPVTWEEPWGLVPLEAMAVGRPVLASRAGGGAAEYLRDGENCLQFPPGDPAALAAAVRRLAADADLRSRLIDGGHRTASRFTDQQFHEAVERELHRALEQS